MSAEALVRLRAGELAGSRQLDLRRCGLDGFPREIFGHADTLEILDLSSNRLDSLPDDLDRLHRLRVLFCSGNRFTRLPEVLGRCPRLRLVGFRDNRIADVAGSALPESLEWLILTGNQLERLPEDMSRCRNLRKLMLSGNRLSSLPDGLAACRELGLLRIAANAFKELPAWLAAMPALAWIACGGNPLSAARELAALGTAELPRIAWDELRITGTLGEGASGTILKAEHHASAIAVKLFKGELTSDGFPRSELAACLAAGAHPHLIPATAIVEGHPEGRAAIAMPLVPEGSAPLAGPPSFDSCTRDVYPPTARHSHDAVLAILRATASALAHLHERGILHGDLYGHNLLHDGSDGCLLGDLGAATLLNRDHRLQSCDILAFGHLIGELLERTPEATDDPLIDLQRSCLSAPGLRPSAAVLVMALR